MSAVTPPGRSPNSLRSSQIDTTEMPLKTAMVEGDLCLPPLCAWASSSVPTTGPHGLPDGGAWSVTVSAA